MRITRCRIQWGPNFVKETAAANIYKRKERNQEGYILDNRAAGGGRRGKEEVEKLKGGDGREGGELTKKGTERRLLQRRPHHITFMNVWKIIRLHV